MKTVRRIISSEQVSVILDGLYQRGYEPECFQGVLLDNYACKIEEKTLRLGRTTLRKYLIIREKPTTCWTSCYELIMTDSEQLFNSYYKSWSEEEEKYEMEMECGIA